MDHIRRSQQGRGKNHRMRGGESFSPPHLHVTDRVAWAGGHHHLPRVHHSTSTSVMCTQTWPGPMRV